MSVEIRRGTSVQKRGASQFQSSEELYNAHHAVDGLRAAEASQSTDVPEPRDPPFLHPLSLSTLFPPPGGAAQPNTAAKLQDRTGG